MSEKKLEEMTLEERFRIEKEFYNEEFGKKLNLNSVQRLLAGDEYRNIYPDNEWDMFEIPLILAFNAIDKLSFLFDKKMYNEITYEVDAEWTWRVMIDAHENARRVAIFHPPSKEETPLIENFAYLSFPPAYKCIPTVGSAMNQQLYGKSGTCMWNHVNDFTRETQWIHGFHIEDGVPSRGWILISEEELEERYDAEDLVLYQGVGYGKHATRDEYFKMEPNMDILKYGGNGEVDKGTEFLGKMVTGAPKGEMAGRLDRRHFATGVKIRDMPKVTWDAFDWAKATNEFVKDMRLELLPEFQNATMYTSAVTTLVAFMSQNYCISSSFIWYAVYLGFFVPEIIGLNYSPYAMYPFPTVFNVFRQVALEIYSERMTNLTTGYEVYQPIQLSEKKAPLLWRSKKRYWNEGAPGADLIFNMPRGTILPPRAVFRIIPPALKSGMNIRQFLAKPPSKEFWEILESDEVGVNRETGEVPTLEDVFRIQFVSDPTYEPIPVNKFPKIDFGVGQVWPLDITVEKVEIMVNEGYSGLGDNIEHFSKLADKKMGKKVDEVPPFKPLSEYAKWYRKELGEVHPIYLEYL
ncbi:hypothetical protein [Candidatus Methanoliparum sp. LAM-1]|uniref:hypothetical protein n=1 Tax=Candidatus Methanoliparum sp. LAM-1 TaxID=2874846 RepID=UPI001E630E1D|nr:hypothetical protein [Candidatus Methanoliparum sp. LAM-1]BDC35321.1 hypothetical protein MTLP_00030 [Candidatus Methanoliparum sp. LAM-1]